MEKMFELKLDVNAVNAIFDALQDKPYKFVAGTIANIQQQIREQTNPVEPPKEAEEKTDGE